MHVTTLITISGDDRGESLGSDDGDHHIIGRLVTVKQGKASPGKSLKKLADFEGAYFLQRVHQSLRYITRSGLPFLHSSIDLAQGTVAFRRQVNARPLQWRPAWHRLEHMANMGRRLIRSYKYRLYPNRAIGQVLLLFERGDMLRSLRAAGITQTTGTYDADGDSGYVEDIAIEPAEILVSDRMDTGWLPDLSPCGEKRPGLPSGRSFLLACCSLSLKPVCLQYAIMSAILIAIRGRAKKWVK